MRDIHNLLGISCGDSGNLRDGRMMIVDANGYEIEMVELSPGRFWNKPVRALRPVNAEATKLYHAVCVPGTTHQIVGDVAIVLDEDFA